MKKIEIWFIQTFGYRAGFIFAIVYDVLEWIFALGILPILIGYLPTAFFAGGLNLSLLGVVVAWAFGFFIVGVCVIVRFPISQYIQSQREQFMARYPVQDKEKSE